MLLLSSCLVLAIAVVVFAAVGAVAVFAVVVAAAVAAAIVAVVGADFTVVGGQLQLTPTTWISAYIRVV